MKTQIRYIAAETGISRTHVHAVLTGRHGNPTIDILKRLGLYFKCKAELEIWKQVVGYEGFYEVSNLGNIKSITRDVNTKGSKKRRHTGKPLKKILGSTGYLCAHLSKFNQSRPMGIHRLVAHAFIGPQLTGYHTMHLDGDRTNNNIKNLRYGSPTCNAAFKVDDGTISRGIKRYNAKLSESKVKNIRELATQKIPYKHIAEKYNIGITTVCAVVKRQNWDWVD